MPTAGRPGPRVGVVVQGPGHHVGRLLLLEVLALVIVVVRHVQPERQG